jgi:hypothetical protein
VQVEAVVERPVAAVAEDDLLEADLALAGEEGRGAGRVQHLGSVRRKAATSSMSSTPFWRFCTISPKLRR